MLIVVVAVAAGADSDVVEELGSVLGEGGGELDEGEEKCNVMTAGPRGSSVRFTVIGTAGLWYFRRIRWLRQNFLRNGVSRLLKGCWRGN